MLTHRGLRVLALLLLASVTVAGTTGSVTGSDSPPVGGGQNGAVSSVEPDAPIEGFKSPNGDMVILYIGPRLEAAITQGSPSPSTPIDPEKLARLLKKYDIGLRIVDVDIEQGQPFTATLGPGAYDPGEELLHLTAGETRAVSRVVFVVLTRRSAVRAGMPAVVADQL